MDSFFSLFFAMNCSTMFFDNWSADFDIIGSLPLEVAIIILRNLDGKSLLNAAQVCDKWLRIIKSDRVLRSAVRNELARQRQERLKRHMSWLDSGIESTHSTTHQQGTKKRRVFEKSVAVTEKKAKRTRVPSASTNNLRKFR